MALFVTTCVSAAYTIVVTMWWNKPLVTRCSDKIVLKPDYFGGDVDSCVTTTKVLFFLAMVFTNVARIHFLTVLHAYWKASETFSGALGPVPSHDYDDQEEQNSKNEHLHRASQDVPTTTF